MTLCENDGYMQWVTNNVKTLVVGEKNLVACVYCRQIYETTGLGSRHNCLVCSGCGVDAVMVVKHSPLHKLAKEEQDALLEKWHKEGFTPLPVKRK